MGFKRRPKASELFQSRPNVFNKLGRSFENAFPSIDDVTVELTETGAGRWNGVSRKLGKAALGEFIDCHNPLCYNGGFSVRQILREMISENKTELETTRLCQGYEGSPGGQRIYRPCVNHFNIQVRLKYKNEAEND
jgi:hypothetical protein